MEENKQKALNKLTKRLWNQVEEKDVLRERGGKLYIGNRELAAEQVLQLYEDAVTIKKSALWQLLAKDLQWEANKRIYLESKTTDDLIFPKAILFAVDIIQKKLDKLASK